MEIARHGGLSENSNVTCDSNVVETRRVVFQGSKLSSHRHSGASKRKLCSMGRTWSSQVESLFFLFFFASKEIAPIKAASHPIPFFLPTITRVSCNPCFLRDTCRFIRETWMKTRCLLYKYFRSTSQLIDLVVQRDASFCIACAFGETLLGKMEFSSSWLNFEYRGWGT